MYFIGKLTDRYLLSGTLAKRTELTNITMDQPKLERLLRLMKMLTANNSLTIDEIAYKLDISSRSVYRYIDTFRDAGFVIKKTNNCPNSTNLPPISKKLAS
jgi:biotin operon repressor